jgi:cytochrome c biogenesis protein CcmG/thiol:disulfide interchange protein DsbE
VGEEGVSPFSPARSSVANSQDVAGMNGKVRISNLTTRGQWVGYIFLATAALVMGLVAGRGIRTFDHLVAVYERKPMPLVNLYQLDGGTWSLSEHRGQVVVFNYWASWCAPCWEEAPILLRLSHELGPRGLAIVGVAMDEGNSDRVDAEIRRFVHTLNVDYPIALPQPLSQMAYGMDGLPTTILVDRQGRVAKVYTGAIRERELKANIEVLLAETVASPVQPLDPNSSPK